MLKAVIFDMDGVIIDSEPMHARAAIQALKKYNIEVSMDYLQKFIGSTTNYMCQRMIEEFHIPITAEELLKENNEWKSYLLKQEGYTAVPYIIDLIKDLYHHGLKLTIASSSSSEAINEVMGALGIREYFKDYISGMSVARPKPAPDIFLEAARRLGVSSNECIVIEDSFHGITAARSAKMTCIGFVNPNSGDQDLRQASLLVEGFDEVDYAFIKQIYDMNNTPLTIAETKHLVIRELTVEDISALHKIKQHPQIREYVKDFNDNLDVAIEKHKAYIEKVYRYYGFGIWGIFLKDNELLIGQCGIELKMEESGEIYELGYLLDSAYQGYGYASEFVSTVIRYSFTQLDIPCITAFIHVKNLRSLKLANKIGMQLESKCYRGNEIYYKYVIYRN